MFGVIDTSIAIDKTTASVSFIGLIRSLLLKFSPCIVVTPLQVTNANYYKMLTRQSGAQLIRG
jgi:phage tail tube protein FII